MTGRLSLELTYVYEISLVIFPTLDYVEEQSGELETLLCIYTEGELTEVGTSPICFQIHVEPASGDGEDCSGTGRCFDYAAERIN